MMARNLFFIFYFLISIFKFQQNWNFATTHWFVTFLINLIITSWEGEFEPSFLRWKLQKMPVVLHSSRPHWFVTFKTLKCNTYNSKPPICQISPNNQQTTSCCSWVTLYSCGTAIQTLGFYYSLLFSSRFSPPKPNTNSSKS